MNIVAVLLRRRVVIVAARLVSNQVSAPPCGAAATDKVTTTPSPRVTLLEATYGVIRFRLHDCSCARNIFRDTQVTSIVTVVAGRAHRQSVMVVMCHFI